jgi:hypothetical protein
MGKERGGRGGEMAQTMYAHVNKRIKKKTSSQLPCKKKRKLFQMVEKVHRNN